MLQNWRHCSSCVGWKSLWSSVMETKLSLIIHQHWMTWLTQCQVLTNCKNAPSIDYNSDAHRMNDWHLTCQWDFKIKIKLELTYVGESLHHFLNANISSSDTLKKLINEVIFLGRSSEKVHHQVCMTCGPSTSTNKQLIIIDFFSRATLSQARPWTL